MSQIVSSGEQLTLDLVRAMQNLKKTIMSYGKAKPSVPEGGFLAFWRSVDAAKTIKKVAEKILSAPSFARVLRNTCLRYHHL